MSGALVAEFTKSHPRGPSVTAALTMPSEGFSCTVLFGPSGGGKSTILRCLAGLERPERGRIAMRGRVWLDTDRGVSIPPQGRGVGFLFQDFALFPHMSVAANIGYGVARAGRARRVAELLDRFGLSGLEHRRPRELSGGQQQRVALARAVATRPTLLLLDEPLSALDSQTRSDVRRELRSILKEVGLPAIVVTHDALEAMSLADRVVIVDHGRILQAGTIDEVFSRPATTETARIVGTESVLVGRVARSEEGLVEVELEGGARVHAVSGAAVGAPVHLCIRAEDVALQRDDGPPTTARNRWRGRVARVVKDGPTLRVVVECGFQLTAVITPQAREALGLTEGERVEAVVKATAVHIIDRG